MKKHEEVLSVLQYQTSTTIIKIRDLPFSSLEIIIKPHANEKKTIPKSGSKSLLRNFNHHFGSKKGIKIENK